MDLQVKQGWQEMYVPATAITQITARHTMGRVPIALAGSPEYVCGMARRVGYTGTHDNDLAIYRLKVKEHINGNAMMLPMLFVVDEGFFIDYDEWQKKGNVR